MEKPCERCGGAVSTRTGKTYVRLSVAGSGAVSRNRCFFCTFSHHSFIHDEAFQEPINSPFPRPPTPPQGAVCADPRVPGRAAPRAPGAVDARRPAAGIRPVFAALRALLCRRARRRKARGRRAGGEGLAPRAAVSCRGHLGGEAFRGKFCLFFSLILLFILYLYFFLSALIVLVPPPVLTISAFTTPPFFNLLPGDVLTTTITVKSPTLPILGAGAEGLAAQAAASCRGESVFWTD